MATTDLMPQRYTTEHQQPRVLLAEDDPEMRSMLAFALRRDGYEVQEAADGTEALQMLGSAQIGQTSATQPDLLVSDVLMPGYTGLDLLARIRWAMGRIPVILITAFGDSRTHAEARRLGVAAVLDKPFELDDLRATIFDALERR